MPDTARVIIEIDTGSDPNRLNLQHQQVLEEIQYAGVDVYKGDHFPMTSEDVTFYDPAEWTTLNSFFVENTGEPEVDDFFPVIFDDVLGTQRTIWLLAGEFFFTDSVSQADEISTTGTVTIGATNAYFWASGVA